MVSELSNRQEMGIVDSTTVLAKVNEPPLAVIRSISRSSGVFSFEEDAEELELKEVEEERSEEDECLEDEEKGDNDDGNGSSLTSEGLDSIELISLDSMFSD